MTFDELNAIDLSKFSVDKLVEWYRAFDKKIEIMDEAHTKTTAPLRNFQERLSGYFEQFLTTTGQQTAVTPSGTIHWNHRVTAQLEDAQAFMDFVIANQNFDLMDRRANATACKEFAEKSGALPPGVVTNSIRTIGVRKPGAKAAARK